MPGSNKGEAPDFIVIDDNDKEREVENEGSWSEYDQYITAGLNRAPLKPSIDSSDEEDCVVVEPKPTREPSSSNKRFAGAKRPRHAAHQRLNFRMKIGRLNEYSDSDIIIDFNGTVQRDWEEAALRRRLRNTFNTPCFGAFRAEREESVSVSNPAKKDGRQSFAGSQRGNTDHLQNPEETDQSNASGVSPVGMGSTRNQKGEDLHAGFDRQSSKPGVIDVQSGDQPITSRNPPAAANLSERGGLHAASDVPDSYPDVSGVQLDAASDAPDSYPYVSGVQLDDAVHEIFLTVNVPISEGPHVGTSGNGLDTMVTETDDDLSRRSVQKAEDVGECISLSDSHEQNMHDAEETVNPVNGDTVVSGREQLKETEEFRQAVAEEWARRQLELQKQAQEAARERKRRRIEAERKLGMEVRQQQRLEEIRQSQLKEEQTSDLKEQLRGQIHSKLERLGETCKDMATLLRRLGISVDGGAFPTNQQVNAAYKKALLRFHPDRMPALVKRDVSHQVEAEETFKLISRMKGVLPSVAMRLF